MARPPKPAHADPTAYVAAIEAALTRARGLDVALVGHDFALARAWHATGVPLTIVLATIEEHAAAGRGGPSLGYLRRHVEARARRSRATQAAAAPVGGGEDAPPAQARRRDDLAAARDWLTRLLAWLDRRPGDVAAPFAALHGQAAALAERLDARALPSPSALDAALHALDDALAEAALRACGDEAVARFRAEAARAVARQRGRLDDAALDDALGRYARRRARAAWDLPERG